jgi:hypothetical protein
VRVHLQSRLTESQREFVLQQSVLELAAGNAYLTSRLAAASSAE